ncbi:MAG: hypothetical protein RL693_47 [Verrucomicrobiota bacterium]|jgi:hypothetical protein
MAIKLSANYSKKLGLPEYSSHSFSVSVDVELNDISQVEHECQKLYALLQQSVDQEMQQVGFVPSPSYGKKGASHGAGQKPTQGQIYRLNGNGHQPNGYQQSRTAGGDQWECTEGQRGFILRIINENNMSKQEAEELSQMLFGIGVKQCNKMQASQLIDDLLLKAGKPARQTRWQKPSTQQRAA